MCIKKTTRVSSSNFVFLFDMWLSGYDSTKTLHDKTLAAPSWHPLFREE